VVPGAVRPGLVGRHGEGLKLKVAEPAEGGRANQAVVRVLTELLALRRGDVSIVAGHGSRDKVVAVEGLSAEELDARLAAAVPAADGAKAVARA
jgi:uncharacterized protein YggU (UPF0235/DUF167 family)